MLNKLQVILNKSPFLPHFIYMGHIHFGIPRELTVQLQKKSGIRNFVETGTYLGKTTAWAAEHFNRVHTIEIAEVLQQRAQEKYAHLKNITFHLGDSKTVMGQIVKSLDGPAFFWLDGHWCGRETGGKNNECPVMQEIHDATTIDGSILFVDDLRCFVGPQPFDSGECYPNVTELIDLIRSRRPGYYITIHDDTLIAVPGNLREVIDADWVANYRRRFPNTLSNRIDKWWWRIKNLNFRNEYGS